MVQRLTHDAAAMLDKAIHTAAADIAPSDAHCWNPLGQSAAVGVGGVVVVALVVLT